MVQDKFTGKMLDKSSNLLPSGTGETCDICGTVLINRCLRCGAPVCCPKCCEESEMEADSLALNPCPFCGGKPEFDYDDNGWNWIECSQCHVSSKAGVSAMEDCRPMLAESWNQRA